MKKRKKKLKPSYPEFNLYSSPVPLKTIGWEGLRRIMEENAPLLRRLSFIKPDLMASLVSKGAASLNDPVQGIQVATRFGTLLLTPLIDRNGYRSVCFTFAGERPGEVFRPTANDGQHRHGT